MRRTLLAVFTACGLVSAHAGLFQYTVSLSGPNESPVNSSPGVGIGTVNYNDVAHTLQLQAAFFGLTGVTTAAHIHAPTVNPFTLTAGVATTTPSFAGFPLGVSSGSYSNTLDLTLASSWNASYVTANGGTTAGAEVALASAMASGRAYWNIHSSTFGGGEIRGFLVPEPSSVVLGGLGALGMAGFVWNKRRTKR